MDLPEKEKKVTKTYRLTPDAIALVKKMAKLYGHNPSTVLDSLIKTYAPDAMKKDHVNRRRG